MEERALGRGPMGRDGVSAHVLRASRAARALGAPGERRDGPRHLCHGVCPMPRRRGQGRRLGRAHARASEGSSTARLHQRGVQVPLHAVGSAPNDRRSVPHADGGRAQQWRSNDHWPARPSHHAELPAYARRTAARGPRVRQEPEPRLLGAGCGQDRHRARAAHADAGAPDPRQAALRRCRVLGLSR